MGVFFVCLVAFFIGVGLALRVPASAVFLFFVLDSARLGGVGVPLGALAALASRGVLCTGGSVVSLCIL